MTTYPQHYEPPDPRRMRERYSADQMAWCLRHAVAHGVIMVVVVAAVLAAQFMGLVVLSGPVMVLLLLVAPFTYLWVATMPSRLEAKFQSTHPYSDYVEPRDR